ncbi:PTS glucose transporter subunit IIA [Amycolatopsis sp. K13G38]|uniref:PTS glucose transporter subunit IIA n=1 Tax=Amycolatopsis acididurans TaxID=2724524 RepID=A0ABX1J1P1_9PSEU|nr:PTS glucose transporter subunit IIA [Amycolatopsis acididurans]NKQ53678.1 PTS glucose transporter subunit IIA [Amycolatopsis acididurans]
MSTTVASPATGAAVPMADVPDPVFAQSMVGPGVAVEPEGGEQDALAPIAGTVVTLHPHAFVIAGEDGKGVLVHLGIDTVKQQGEGFTLHVVKGETVRAGQPLIGWNPETVRAAGYSAVVPVVALDAQAGSLSGLPTGGPVVAGEQLFVWD